jgi:hypothetical protein
VNSSCEGAGLAWQRGVLMRGRNDCVTALRHSHVDLLGRSGNPSQFGFWNWLSQIKSRAGHVRGSAGSLQISKPSYNGFAIELFLATPSQGSRALPATGARCRCGNRHMRRLLDAICVRSRVALRVFKAQNNKRGRYDAPEGLRASAVCLMRFKLQTHCDGGMAGEVPASRCVHPDGTLCANSKQQIHWRQLLRLR